MKRHFLLLFLFSIYISAYGQNEFEALLFARTNVLGTARSAGVGGAFGALGADLTCFSLNPAGIALYRQSEFGFSLNSLMTSNKSLMFENESSLTKTGVYAGFNSLGIVGLVKSTDQSGWVSVNYGFAYNKIKDFNNSISINGVNWNNSITDFFANQAGRSTEAELASNTSDVNPWGRMAYQAHLIEVYPDYSPSDASYYYSILDSTGQTQQKRITTTGNIGEYSFALAANYENKFYFGASLAITSLHYNEVKNFGENKDCPYQAEFNKYSMNYEEKLDIAGSGYNLKLGIIYSPIKRLRLGLGLQTPTYYDLSMNYSGRVSSQLALNTPAGLVNYTSSEDVYKYDYQYKTPLKLSASVAYIFPRAFLSLDYEYLNYGGSTYNATDYDFQTENEIIKDSYTAAMNVKLGGEVKLGEVFCLRAGAGYFSSPYKQLSNRKDGSVFTMSAGAGLHLGALFVDLALVTSKTKETDFFYRTLPSWSPAGADVDQASNRTILTLSYKF